MRRTRGLITLLVACLAIVTAVVAWRRLDVVEVRGRSMAPTLLPGDRLVVARDGPPRVGDVVLAVHPREPRRELIKRVTSVRAGLVMLRGDAPSSTDSRAFGPLPVDRVAWKVLGRYWPLRRIGPVDRRPVPLQTVDEGGEPACSFPEALIAGDWRRRMSR